MKKLFTLLLAGIMALAIVACGGGDKTPTSSDKPEPTPPTSVPAQEEDKTVAGPSFANSVFKSDEFEIKITEHRVIPVGETGNEYGDKPVIAFWYEVKNINDDDLDPMLAWIFTFTAIQDNNPNAVNKLDVAPLPDEQFLNTQTEKIKIGGTVSNAMAYYLDDDTTPVTLVAADILGDEYGQQDFALK
jgi:ABC-type glycerol-3-phosphate transport system substrate-binding protein